MRLFHFVPDEYARKNLENRRLKVAFPNEVNDVFEHKPFDFGDRKTRKEWKRSIDEASQTKGFICFSSCWSSPAMWAHYADNHQGACLGFDIPDSNVDEIAYVPDLRPFNKRALIDKNTLDREMRYALETKAKDWEYEKEWRLHVKLSDEEVRAKRKGSENLFFLYFSQNLIIREVIIGLNSTIDSSFISKNLSSEDDVDIITARTSFRRYGMVPQERPSLQK